jgi:hypothetical protein
MQRNKLKAAVLICATASLTTAIAPASASAGARSPADAVIVDCFSHPQVRPKEFLIACGDGNSLLTALRWSDWKPNFAAGKGLNVVNDCRPFCAAGTFHSYPVTVRLDRSEPLKKHPHQRHYTQLRLVFTDSRPAQTPKEVTYRLWS